MPRPRTWAEPTSIRDILRADPLATRLRDEAERVDVARRSGVGTKYGPGFFLLGETRDMKRAAEEFVVGGGILTKGGKLLIYAGSGVGKTTFLDHLAACLASGGPFLGRFAIDRPRRVLFVQGELAPSELASHGQDLLDTFKLTAAVDGLIFWLQTQLKLPRDFDRLRDAVRHTESELVILDPFSRFFAGQSSTQPEEVNRLFESIDRLLEDPTLAVDAAVVAHHMNIAQARAAGSWAFEGWPSTMIRLDRVPGRGDSRLLTFEKLRSPDSVLLGSRLVVHLGTGGYLVDEASSDNSGSEGRGIACLTDFVRVSGGEAWRRDAVAHLRVALGVQMRQSTNIISAACHTGEVVPSRIGRQVRLRLRTETAGE